MNMRGVDLNLLTILTAVLEEGGVSRAASRLGMSQPAVSSALERCRHLFGDPLLERHGNAMAPTARGAALRQPLAEIMDTIAGLIGLDPPPLSEVKRVVHLAMADAVATRLGPMLHEALAAQAPGIVLALHPWRGGSAALAELARGPLDLVISVLPASNDPAIHSEIVLRERYLVAMRRDHPAADRFDLDTWLAWPHLIVSASGATDTPVDAALRTIGRSRSIGMVVPSFVMVPNLLAGSDLVALVPALMMDGAVTNSVVTFEPPLPIDGFSLRLAWHRRNTHDVAVQHVASEMMRLANTTR
ncbi:transcriptional regulator, LysR family [Sphingomonas gellani]|uniref:Transcriptional regulator, LysR family n=1 Tax=Sphingomonas gellani TaxID=1166340 RepID=A0A1H8J821_9SPHN|nr:LysR family transcriptional regulator [Sphingomonas gellani]SEN76248.1 transcriptional regulator, LysR family [Sphingomonas gellani]